MYSVAVLRELDASHFLTGGDWGSENLLHLHHYRVEAQLEGPTLDEHGYLVDILEIEKHLDALIGCYRDKTLNELEPFAGLNPSLERFAGILCEQLANRLRLPRLTTIIVKIWENEIAWAACRRPL